ncbi:hypothetical protein SPRG_20159 [Saprolegnia parasitica CBS 223.65]|uniref:Uncharacterized protein n=1 Tax=Saprolegnia parasitica (strain CBS 223.65) TaxID=695850 RepID=A0A067CD09_SAPPC|nr:hypothetical protein SPRG_20159 [Saprolegnia parasitica CBS 223.65]KDO28383.1 hypothetical protein SPRG_20159 [Saprolegnia parasitica CBS 223.65]|eukprot:XP_012200957.1 hypothetical protein SPRG_20159 [Saprolegnia parasitica CBS 223.65]
MKSVSWARLHTSRHSGSATDSIMRLSVGRTLGVKSMASAGSSTSLHMLSIMTAVWRLTAVLFSLRPRTRSGSMMARAGASTVLTNVVDASLWTHSETSAGLAMHEMSAGMKGSISAFEAVPQALIMRAWAAFLTSARVSQICSEALGMMSGKQRESWTGWSSARSLIKLSAPSFVCHFLVRSRPEKICGRSTRSALWLAACTMALAAAAAGARTVIFLSAYKSRTAPRSGAR